MKLISELVEEVKYLVEEKESGKKAYYITGPYIQAEQKNRNGRIYKLPIIEREVNRYNNEYIKTNRALGELGHPQGPTINLDRVACKHMELRQEGNNFIGKSQILDTPMGLIARNLLESGVTLGVSTRGMGSLKEKNGVMEVQDDFFLATAADIVADPSAPDAFVQGIMEGVEWVWDNGIFKAHRVEEMKTLVKKSSSKNLQETKLYVFEQLLRNYK